MVLQSELKPFAKVTETRPWSYQTISSWVARTPSAKALSPPQNPAQTYAQQGLEDICSVVQWILI